MEAVKSTEIDRTLQNLIRHLKFYFKKNNTSALQVSKIIGISNQNMYNILDASNYPAINTIVKICNIFNCSASEILAPELFLDIPIYDNLSAYENQNIKQYRRVYFPIKYEDILLNELFILNYTFEKSDMTKFFNMTETELPTIYGHLLYKFEHNISLTGGTGKYIAKIENELVAIDLCSLSGDTAKIRIHQQKASVQIDCNKIELLHKYVGLLTLTDNNDYYLRSTAINHSKQTY